MAEVLSRPSSSSMSTSRLFNRLDERDLSPSRSYDPTSTGDWDYTSRDHTHSYATYALHTTAPKRLPMLNPDLFMISGQTNESQAGMLSWMHSMSSKQIAYHRQQLKFHQRELEYWQDLSLMALDLFRSKGTQEDYSVLTERTYASLRGAGAQTERLREDSMGDDIPQPISHLTLDRPPLVRPAGSRFRSRRIPQKAAAKRTKQFLKEFAERIQRIFKGINLQFSNVTSNFSSHSSFHPPSTTLPPKRTSSPSSSVNTSPHHTSTTLPSHQYTNSTSSITLNPAFDNTSPGHSFSSNTPVKFPAKKQPPPLSSASNNSLSSTSNNNSHNNHNNNNNTESHSPAIPKKPMNLRIQSLSNADQDQTSPTSQSGSGLFKITEERQASTSRVSTSSLISPAVTAVAGNTVVELPKPKNANSAGFQQAVASLVQQAQQTPPPPSTTSAPAPALPATRPSQHQRDSLIQIRQSQSGLAIAAAAAQSRPLKSAQYPTAQSARLSRAAVDAAIKGSSVKSPRSQSTSLVTPTMGTAKALHSYIESTHGAEYLSFNAGDVVLIVDDGSNVPGGGGGWWLVDLMGAIGYVPSNFFTRLEAT